MNLLQFNTLKEMFTANDDLCCPICTEPYDFENKNPSVMCTNQHQSCMQCFETLRAQKSICPECRAPLNFKGERIRPNQTVVKMMEAMKVQFEAIQTLKAQLSQAPGVQPSKPVARPSPMEISPVIIQEPENFKLVTFAEEKFEHRSIADEVQLIQVQVAEAMDWNPDQRAELIGEYNRTATLKQWVLFWDKAENRPLGFSQLKLSSPNKAGEENKYEMHWAGIIEKNKPELYFELYKQLFNVVGSKRQAVTNADGEKYSLTCFFNIKNPQERSMKKRIEMQLLASDIRRDCLGVNRGWGFQERLTAYPYPIEGLEQKALNNDPTKCIEMDVSFEDKTKPRVEECLNTGLRDVFIKMFPYGISKDPNADLANMIESFRKNPENFFVYFVDGQVRGFIQFDRDRAGNFNVHTFKLLPAFQKYADHFVRQFKAWATTKNCFSKGTPAKELQWTCLNNAVEAIRNAIFKIMDF